MLSEMADDGAASTTGTRERQREATRRRLLDAALDEFLAHGYGGASTRRICAAAGVSHGLLFHHYASKSELHAALVQLGAARVSFEPEGAAADPLAFFTGQAEWVLTMLREQPRTARMFVFMDQALATSGAGTQVDTLRDDLDIVRRAVPVIESGQRAGVIRPGSATALSLVFWATLQGVAREAWADPTLDLPEPSWVVDLLRDGAA